MVTNKLAETQYPIHDLLRQRWSPRAFSAQPVEADKLGSLLEAARWAPSSFNEQPWSFIVAMKDRPGEFDRLLSCLVESNRLWARHAPALMLSVAKLQFEKDGRPNRHAFHDVGLAVANLMFQATALGLVVHQMAGFDVGKARQEFDIPDGYEPVAAIAVGYQGDPAILPDRLRDLELARRSRKAMNTCVFSRRWGQPFHLISQSESA